MAINPGLTGSVINALPMDKMIGAPLTAMIQAQTDASHAYVEFIHNICIRDGKAITTDFEYDQSILDSDGKLVGVQTRSVRIPLLASVVHPVMCIEEGTIDFVLDVNQAQIEKVDTGVEVTANGGLNWGLFKASFTAKVTHSNSQTRSSDTRAKYTFHTSIKRGQPPEAMMRVIDFLTDSATTPVVVDSTPGVVASEEKPARIQKSESPRRDAAA